MTLPPKAKSGATSSLVQAVFDLIEMLGSNPPSLRPETKLRLRQRRDELEVELKKDAEREEKEIAEDTKRTEKKTKKDEMIASMSAAEQKKVSSISFPTLSKDSEQARYSNWRKTRRGHCERPK